MASLICLFERIAQALSGLQQLGVAMLSLLLLFLSVISYSSGSSILFSPEILNAVSNSSCVENSTVLCLPADGVTSCIQCSDESSDPQRAVDMNIRTSWSSDLVSELYNGRAELIINFKKVT